jgi:WD40 repeat protein
LFQGHNSSVTSVAFSPDGQRIVSGSDDKTVRLWDLQGKAIGQPFQGHSDSVTSVAFSPDGQRLVSGSDDNTVRLWQGDWHGWLKTACTQLKDHPVFRNPDQSFDPAIAKEAKEACEQRIWETVR